MNGTNPWIKRLGLLLIVGGVGLGLFSIGTTAIVGGAMVMLGSEPTPTLRLVHSVGDSKSARLTPTADSPSVGGLTVEASPTPTPTATFTPIAPDSVALSSLSRPAIPTPEGTPPTPTPAPLVSEEAYTALNSAQAREAAIEADSEEADSEAAIYSCPATSAAAFDLIPIEGRSTDRPHHLHADFNLALRGFEPVAAERNLVSYRGATDPEAPRLAGLFQPNRVPEISSTYAVRDWRWQDSDCGAGWKGCQGDLIDQWDTTLVGMATTPGEPISPPERNPQIYAGGYKALVLYADEQQITLGYTRLDSVAVGYTVHIESICVDPNLLRLYQAQHDANGWRTGNSLPALRNDQVLGTARGAEIQVAIRDNGTFMDPRSDKDWWR